MRIDINKTMTFGIGRIKSLNEEDYKLMVDCRKKVYDLYHRFDIHKKNLKGVIVKKNGNVFKLHLYLNCVTNIDEIIIANLENLFIECFIEEKGKIMVDMRKIKGLENIEINKNYSMKISVEIKYNTPFNYFNIKKVLCYDYVDNFDRYLIDRLLSVQAVEAIKLSTLSSNFLVNKLIIEFIPGTPSVAGGSCVSLSDAKYEGINDVLTKIKIENYLINGKDFSKPFICPIHKVISKYRCDMYEKFLKKKDSYKTSAKINFVRLTKRDGFYVFTIDIKITVSIDFPGELIGIIDYAYRYEQNREFPDEWYKENEEKALQKFSQLDPGYKYQVKTWITYDDNSFGTIDRVLNVMPMPWYKNLNAYFIYEKYLTNQTYEILKMYNDFDVVDIRKVKVEFIKMESIEKD